MMPAISRIHSLYLQLAICFVLACASFLAQPAAFAAQPELYVPNGPLVTGLRIGNTLYIGGEFDRIGPAVGQMVIVDSATGTQQSGWPRVAGPVNSIVADGSGGWYIGGNFAAVGGVSRRNLAHILPDKTLDSSFDPQTDGSVLQLLLNGSTLYVCGEFELLGGQQRKHIGAVDTSTGLVTSFDPSANDDVWSMALDGTTLYVGGSFNSNSGAENSIGSAMRDYIAALDTGTGYATLWDPDPNGVVRKITLAGSPATSVFVGGSFAAIGVASRAYLAEIDLGTGLATAWNPVVDGAVNAIALDGTSVYVGGEFSNVNSTGRSYAAAVDAASGATLSWNPAANDYVRAIAVSSGAVYVGGEFTTIGGASHIGAVAVDATNGTPNSWDAKLDNHVYEIAITGTNIALGGVFSSVAGTTRRNAAAIDLSTGQPTSWNPDPDGPVLAMINDGNTIYMGGQFANLSMTPRNLLAAVDATGPILPFNPNVTGTSVGVLALKGSTLYVGGTFTNIGAETRKNLASIDVSSGNATSWSPLPDARVHTIAFDGDTLYAGGEFTIAAGVSRAKIASFDGSGNLTSWNPVANDAVLAIYPGTDAIYVGGSFTGIGGKIRRGFAALSKATGLANSVTLGAFTRIVAITPYEDQLLLSGMFYSFLSPTNYFGVVMADPVSGELNSWNPEVLGLGYKTIVADHQVIALGVISSAYGQPLNSIADISPLAASVEPAAPAGTAKDGETLTSSDNGTWYGAGAITYARVWNRCNASGTGCESLSGETASTYVLTAADVGNTIRASIDATDAVMSTDTLSAATSVIAPKNTTKPKIRGVLKVSKTLETTNGSWHGVTELTFSYQWKRCNARGARCSNISGARSVRYTLTRRDAGKKIVVSVKASKNGSAKTEALSQASRVVGR